MKLIFAVLAVFLLLFAGCTTTTPEQTGWPTAVTTGPSVVTTEPSATTSVPAAVSPGYTDVSAAVAKQLIDDNPEIVIIDVSPHYADGHLPGAVSYYLGDGSLDRAIPSLDKDATYLVYCHIDSVSIAGAQKLVDAGFTSVYRLEGNYRAWVDAGYPVEK